MKVARKFVYVFIYIYIHMMNEYIPKCIPGRSAIPEYIKAAELSEISKRHQAMRAEIVYIYIHIRV